MSRRPRARSIVFLICMALLGAAAAGAPQQAPLIAAPPDFDRTVPPHEIHFASASSALTRRAKRILQQQARWLERHRSVRIVLEGHADDRGPRNRNMSLSIGRARAAQAYLQQLGLSADRITLTGYGEERPASASLDADGRAANRRVVTTVAEDAARAP